MLEKEIQIEMAELQTFCGEYEKANGAKTPIENSEPKTALTGPSCIQKNRWGS